MVGPDDLRMLTNGDLAAEDLHPAAQSPTESAAQAAMASPRALLRPGSQADLGSEAELVLALDALHLRRLLRFRNRPGPWLRSDFGRRVDRTRAQLEPLGDTALLAASFDREAFHGTGSRRVTVASSPPRVAYAIRWLELRGAERFPAWPVLVARGGAPA